MKKPNLNTTINSQDLPPMESLLLKEQHILEFLLDYPDRTYQEAFANLIDEILAEPDDYPNITELSILLFILKFIR